MKLTNEDVVKIRELYYKEGYSYYKLAKMYNRTPGTIKAAVRGLGAYRDIPDTVTLEDKQRRAERGIKTYKTTCTEIMRGTGYSDEK